MHDFTPTRRQTMAKTAAARAATLRQHAADIGQDALEPLRAAWRMRAAELELAARVLGDEPVLQPVLVDASRRPVSV